MGATADADSVSIVAMASMALQASGQRRVREAIDLATAARRAARSAATPRLTSVLLAREALGRARVGDAPSVHACLCPARGLVANQTGYDDDASWLDFYGPPDFASHEYRVELMLGESAGAEDAARTALALGNPRAYPRNHALDVVNLADVLARRRKVDECVAVATRARVAATGMDSARVSRGIVAITRDLAPSNDDPGVGQFLDRFRETTRAH